MLCQDKNASAPKSTGAAAAGRQLTTAPTTRRRTSSSSCQGWGCPPEQCPTLRPGAERAARSSPTGARRHAVEPPRRHDREERANWPRRSHFARFASSRFNLGVPFGQVNPPWVPAERARVGSAPLASPPIITSAKRLSLSASHRPHVVGVRLAQAAHATEAEVHAPRERRV